VSNSVPTTVFFYPNLLHLTLKFFCILAILNFLHLPVVEPLVVKTRMEDPKQGCVEQVHGM